MVRNYWITKDYYDQIVNVNFAEPSLAWFNVALHLTGKEDLRYLVNAEIMMGWKFQAEQYTLECTGANKLKLTLSGHHCCEYIYTDLFQQVAGEYLAELEKIEAYYRDRS